MARSEDRASSSGSAASLHPAPDPLLRRCDGGARRSALLLSPHARAALAIPAARSGTDASATSPSRAATCRHALKCVLRCLPRSISSVFSIRPSHQRTARDRLCLCAFSPRFCSFCSCCTLAVKPRVFAATWSASRGSLAAVVVPRSAVSLRTQTLSPPATAWCASARRRRHVSARWSNSLPALQSPSTRFALILPNSQLTGVRERGRGPSRSRSASRH